MSATGSYREAWLWLAGYLALVAAIVAALVIARNRVLSTPDQAAADWQEWKADATKQTGNAGPVQRAAPKSDEPPSTILLRDYFPGVMVGLLLPVSALYLFAAWTIRGVIRQSRVTDKRSGP